MSIRFLLQTPPVHKEASVGYDPKSHNLYTINEMTSGKSFYQTFGDLVLNFDVDTGRLYSLDGRIDLAAANKKSLRWPEGHEEASLLTNKLEIGSIGGAIKYAFDQESKIFLAECELHGKKLSYAYILENVVLGLTDEGELVRVFIRLD